MSLKLKLALKGMFALGIAAAFVPLNAAPTPSLPTAARWRPTAVKGLTVRFNDASPAVRAAVTELRARTKWVGDIHHLAIKEAIAGGAIVGLTADEQRKRGCEMTVPLLEKYINQVDAKISGSKGNQTSREYAKTVLRQLKPCNSIGTFSATSASGPLATAGSAALDLRDDAYGAFQDYDWMIEGAVDSASSAWDVDNAVNDILSSAYSAGIPNGDLETLSGEGSLAVSSAYDWESQYPEHAPNLFSIFARPAPMRFGKWWKIAGADAVGCATGAGSAWWAVNGEILLSGGTLAPVASAQLVGQCAIWGIGGSIATWLTL